MDKLYITINGSPVKLSRIDQGIEAAIQSDIAAGGVVFELKSEYWSVATGGLPENPKAVYISGSHPSVPIVSYPDVTAFGQMAVFREQEGQQKSYRFLLVESGNELFYGQEFKKFPEHYYSGSHPTGSIWTKNHPQWPKL